MKMPYTRVFPLKSKFGRLILLALAVLVFVVFSNLFYGFSILVNNAKWMSNLPGASYGYRESRLFTNQNPPSKFQSIIRIAARRFRGSQICRHPKLSLFHDTIKHAFHDMEPLVCLGTSLFYFDNGILTLNLSVKLPDKLSVNYDSREVPLKNRPLTGTVIENIKKCEYNGIDRVTDDYYTYTETMTKTTAPYNLIVQQDFLSVRCFLNKTDDDKNEDELENGHYGFERLHENLYNDTDYKFLKDDWEHDDHEHEQDEIFAREVWYAEGEKEADFNQFLVQVYPKPEVFKRISHIQPSEHSTGMNVLIIGLDSLSHLAYQRKLPNTYRYLRDHLDVVVLDAHNIVGDATTAALIPMLTGKTETELPEVRIQNDDSTTVDIYPFVWNEFRDSGYVTMFAEDEPSIGAFNLRLNGFNEQPTDHYMRPFWQAIWSSHLHENSARYCTGDKAHHNYTLEYVKDFFVKYKNVSKFAFVFMSELTHWDNNPGEYIDMDLLHLLQFFQRSGYLDNTVLMMMADHGARYSKVRYTVQGKLEERLPMFAVRFPLKFQSQHPKLAENLQRNARRLTTPFDIHETLRDILNISRTKIKVKANQRGISLLQQIPLERTCASAHIDMHWCTCLIQDNQDVNSEHVQRAANEIIVYINQLTKPVREHCVELKLKSVILAYLLIPNERVLRYLKSKDDDNRIANFSKEVSLDIVHYQITMETIPNNAVFEATIMMNITDGRLKINPEISRLNLYGDQPSCVQRRYPDLRKYCYCLEHLPQLNSSFSVNRS